MIKNVSTIILDEAKEQKGRFLGTLLQILGAGLLGNLLGGIRGRRGQGGILNATSSFN